MELKEQNDKYLELKQQISKIKKEIENLDAQANELSDKKAIQMGKKVEAKRKGDNDAMRAAEEALDEIAEDSKKLMTNVISKKNELVLLQDTLQEKIEVIKQNPEMKRYLEEVMEKKYSRKIMALNVEEEKLLDQKDKITIIQKLVTDHPSLNNNLTGIMTATKELNELKAELEAMSYKAGDGLVRYKDEKRAQEINAKIPELEARKKTNKESFMVYVSKHNINISENDIMDLAEKEFVADGKGNVDMTATMNKNISGINRQLKSIDKSKNYYNIALNRVGNTRQENSFEAKFSDESKLFSDPNVEYIMPTSKPKWFQFVSRFKNWNERRKQRKLEEPDQEIFRDDEEENAGEHDDKKDKFKDSLKYDIVKDIVGDIEKTDLKEAKKEFKAQQHKDDDIYR